MNKILIANRGEIAVRVIRTARDLGFRTVAVYSTADADAMHVHEADQAVCIGSEPASESYLRVDKILAAAAQTGADAIHPGYGFLSENGQFSSACSEADIIFIGPDSAAIELMGSKRLSKIAMIEAGVPCIPGYQGEEQDDEKLLLKAQEIGFPIMVKASFGGGGRGMRLVHQPDELAEQMKMARSEAQNAFGSGELILERAIIEPRHIEIQIFADRHGNVVYLGERDCSIQRRHQKVVEEAPSPFVDELLRQKMGEAAVNAAKSCQYVGAGTIEFLVDKDKNFYFLEMNTRLQVEHPVTELITGLDLVAWQLMVAAGQPLPLVQDDIHLRGHAVEVRLYAEDPRNNFIPQTGTVLCWRTSHADASSNIRIDHSVAEGQVVSTHYDPMLGKVIAYGDDRQTAVRRLASAVQDIVLLGVNTNKHFLHKVLRHPVFTAGEATTAFIEQQFSTDSSVKNSTPELATVAKAALLFYLQGAKSAGMSHGNPWQTAVATSYSFKLEHAGEVMGVQLSCEANCFQISLGDYREDAAQSLTLEWVSCKDNRCVVVESGVRQAFDYVFDSSCLFLDDGSGHYIFDNITHQPASAGGGVGNGEVVASMDGSIVEVLVKTGDVVEQGQTILVIEAMKMEHPLKSDISGIVKSLTASVGQQVKSKQLLATVIDQ